MPNALSLSLKPEGAAAAVAGFVVKGIADIVDACFVARIGNSRNILILDFAAGNFIAVRIFKSNYDAIRVLIRSAYVDHILRAFRKYVRVLNIRFVGLLYFIAFYKIKTRCQLWYALRAEYFSIALG